MKPHIICLGRFAPGKELWQASLLGQEEMGATPYAAYLLLMAELGKKRMRCDHQRSTLDMRSLTKTCDDCGQLLWEAVAIKTLRGIDA